MEFYVSFWRFAVHPSTSSQIKSQIGVVRIHRGFEKPLFHRAIPTQILIRVVVVHQFRYCTCTYNCCCFWVKPCSFYSNAATYFTQILILNQTTQIKIGELGLGVVAFFVFLALVEGGFYFGFAKTTIEHHIGKKGMNRSFETSFSAQLIGEAKVRRQTFFWGELLYILCRRFKILNGNVESGLVDIG